MDLNKTERPPFFIDNIEITDIDQEGRGVGRFNEIVVFVEKALPGDIATVRVFKKKSKYWEGSLSTLTIPSPLRQAPICKHFGICGGCQWQHFQYESQKEYKAKSVLNALGRIGGLTLPELKPILGSSRNFYYRNKLNFSFSNRKWLKKEEKDAGVDPFSPALGFHISKIFDKVYGIEKCYLMPDIHNAIRRTIFEVAVNENIPFYDLKAHTGYLRTLVIRQSANSGEIMLNLIVAYSNADWINLLFENVRNKFPQITSFIYYINQKLNDSYTDLPYSVWGDSNDYLLEKLGKYYFKIGPNSFFQTNTYQAINLYQIIYNLIGSKVSLIYDLYCGTGSIGIFISDLAEKIIGIEYVPEAIEDAKQNCALNNLTHFDFYAGDMKKILNKNLLHEYGIPDLIITDPPRAGMDAKVVEQLLEIKAAKVIYVSCNPATQARDISLMQDLYQVTYVQPVDMFPQTTHVENIVLLERKF